jgi:hypothetical protein
MISHSLSNENVCKLEMLLAHRCCAVPSFTALFFFKYTLLFTESVSGFVSGHSLGLLQMTNHDEGSPSVNSSKLQTTALNVTVAY